MYVTMDLRLIFLMIWEIKKWVRLYVLCGLLFHLLVSDWLVSNEYVCQHRLFLLCILQTSCSNRSLTHLTAIICCSLSFHDCALELISSYRWKCRSSSRSSSAQGNGLPGVVRTTSPGHSGVKRRAYQHQSPSTHIEHLEQYLVTGLWGSHSRSLPPPPSRPSARHHRVEVTQLWLPNCRPATRLYPAHVSPCWHSPTFRALPESITSPPLPESLDLDQAHGAVIALSNAISDSCLF